MILNAGWTYAFFGAHMTAFALIILLALFIVSAWMARVFFDIDRRTVWFIVPYLLWMMFAFYMNAYIVLMN